MPFPLNMRLRAPFRSGASAPSSTPCCRAEVFRKNHAPCNICNTCPEKKNSILQARKAAGPGSIRSPKNADRPFSSIPIPSQEVSVINTIDTEKCTGCGTCFKTCGLDVFRLDTDQPVLSPCMAKCPAGIDIRGYNGLMQMGSIDEAAERLRERNPFPAVTGRVCPHLCESECSRGKVDGAVNINGIEQYLGDRTLLDAPQKPAVRHVHRIAVVGSGPAGLPVAWYLARAGYPVRVFEAMPKPGGMLRYGIPVYRLPDGRASTPRFEQLKALGVEFQLRIRASAKGRDLQSWPTCYELGYTRRAPRSRRDTAPARSFRRARRWSSPGVLYGRGISLRGQRTERASRRTPARSCVVGGGSRGHRRRHHRPQCSVRAERSPVLPRRAANKCPPSSTTSTTPSNAGVTLHPGLGPRGRGRRILSQGHNDAPLPRRCSTPKASFAPALRRGRTP